MCYLLLLASFLVSYQTNWMGGSGVLGPVNNWGSQYWASDSVTTATEGQVSLIATEWDYANWVRHIVDTANPGIWGSTQGFMPADIDNDGIVDLVAQISDSVVWYKHSGYYNFSSKNIIGPADDGGWITPCVYPCDLDKDGNIDVLVATHGTGVGWYKNPTWTYYNLDNSTGYHRISAADVELDGDIDIIAVDNAIDWFCGNIYLFRDTTGKQDFKKELIVAFPDSQAWRVYPADFNNDGYPDLYAVHFDVHIFLNDSTGHFYHSWSFNGWPGKEFDGAWAEDINMDGNMDLVCGNQYNFPYGFFGFLNDSGTGDYFNVKILALDGTNSHMDGAIARDIDLDGFPDIAGTLYRAGWFRQDPANPLTFAIYPVDTALVYSHWIYAAPLCNRCTPAIDLLVTDAGRHIVYENQMLTSFADIGYLESSILKITTPDLEPCTLKFFAYDACVPNNTSLSFYWRAGPESVLVIESEWEGPYPASVGMNVADSFSIPDSTGRMFQYKAEFKNGDDIAVLYEVRLHYKCSSVDVEEVVPSIQKLQILKGAMGNKLILKLPFDDYISLKLYDVTGRLVRLMFDGHLPSGTYKFDISQQSNGIYFAKCYSTQATSQTLKLIKLR